VQIIEVVDACTLALLQLGLTISLNELINAHEAATDAHHQPIVHNLCKDLTRSKHIETCAQSCYRQINTHVIDVLLKHLIDSVASDRSVGLLSLLLHIKLLSVDVSVVNTDVQLAN